MMAKMTLDPDNIGPVDLMDFYDRWPEFRPRATLLMNRLRVEGEDDQIVEWLVALADRVGPKDLDAEEAGDRKDEVWVADRSEDDAV